MSNIEISRIELDVKPDISIENKKTWLEIITHYNESYKKCIETTRETGNDCNKILSEFERKYLLKPPNPFEEEDDHASLF